MWLGAELKQEYKQEYAKLYVSLEKRKICENTTQM